MKNIVSYLYLALFVFIMTACQGEDAIETPPPGNDSTDNNNSSDDNSTNSGGNTLIVYYSYTNNTEQIAFDLKSLIDADVIEVEPANKNLDYAADNYAIGTQQLNRIKNSPNDESSYPAIDPVTVDMGKYDTVIIATPLWWSQMASNMQTFLFKYGKEMAGKNIGLIVSSHSSGISGVEADARRLVPGGRFFQKSLWINSSKHPQRKSLLEQWLKDINYDFDNSATTMNLKVNNNSLKVKLADNAATKALLERLKEGTITYNANDYGGFEKVGALGFTLPSNDAQIMTEPGDIMLYNGNQLCIFFESNTWSYTPIGKIEGMTGQQLKETLGAGEVSITLMMGDRAVTAALPVNPAN